MNTQPIPDSGRFVWFELMSDDRTRAVDFYTRLFGWGTVEEDMGGAGKYIMFTAGGVTIAGCCTRRDGPRPYWLAYVTVPDADAAGTLAAGLGGKVLVAGTDVPNIGRFTVIQDPTGAVIAPFTSAGHNPQTPEILPAGHFCWHELMSKKPAEALAFYRRIFGWSNGEMDMGEHGKYYIFKRGEKDTAGLMQTPPEVPDSFWLYYVLVDDVDATAAKALGLGGKVWVEPKDIPQIGRFAVLGDPGGATIAIFRGV